MVQSFRASEVSRINGHGFNFDVVPSLVGIWCLLILRFGVVGGAWEIRDGRNGFRNGFRGAEQELEVWNMVRGFRVKDRSYRTRIKSSGAKIGESGIID